MAVIHLSRLKDAANSVETLKNLLSNVTFQKSSNGYRAKEHGSYCIYRKRDKWLFAAHNGDYKGGDPLSIAAEIHGLNLKTADGLHRAVAIVCEAAGLRFENFCSDTEPMPTATPTGYLFNLSHVFER